MAYQDTHRYRVGVNANQLPVNAARCPVHHYQRDGAMAGCPMHGGANQGSSVNFYPNDRINEGAPVPEPGVAEPPMPLEQEAWVGRHGLIGDEDHYSQAGDLFRLMDDGQRQSLARAIAEGLVQASESVQRRMLEQFARADAEYAERVETAMAEIRG